MTELETARIHAERLRLLGLPAASDAAAFIEKLAKQLQGSASPRVVEPSVRERRLQGSLDGVRKLFAQPRSEQQALLALWERADDSAEVEAFVAANRLSQSLTQDSRNLRPPTRRERAELLKWLRYMLCRFPNTPRYAENFALVAAYEEAIQAYEVPVSTRDAIRTSRSGARSAKLELPERTQSRIRFLRSNGKTLSENWVRIADDLEFLSVDLLLRQEFFTETADA